MTDLASDFDFDLPPALVADHPARPRDSARLLDIPVAGPFQDRIVRDLPSLLRPGDLLVANDTAVIPAQLDARRGEARIGITLDRILPDGTWHALARNARRLRAGDVLTFAGVETTAGIVSRDAEGGVILRFDAEGPAFDAFLQTAGALALPPYIARPDGPTEADRDDYRTIFSEHRGAVAAPTAGLHFTPGLLAALDAAGVARRTLTLHVGAGTFLPVRGDSIAAHRMHAERGVITAETAAAINATRAAGGRIVAVGTTTLRLLESAAEPDGTIRPFDGDTAIFIRPGYRFRAVDMLMTNFHLPRSTLFMLVCAFAGYQRMRDAYAHAVADGYRFYSYGDACLLHRAPSPGAPA
ncbi:tRNA preQ1(34) S-adenosylmethionine ribosyltransferase-isomerase QueA [Gluconacetobacter azotocaptans]|uniref:tRNA preQ1(34) S-adenosylmethionine ribosyltransferase-isomerase QueA n=1 Tax=Gluconacetobacter azotocaptans TaxID=142834 RepID=UPI00195E56C1|nr:tRNA preQ1(34) S-adenosylmethionine ribosyltransferase-isomerase QueA [Gluconacetobacter azotocaptans]MBM9402021.1 tRNA preQ1(34) S-adenosylmethionine ribosyltransferase-isomerase QueA [Gluconacetobacter azotocaptans]